jgi:hypothetical protein
MLFTKWFRLTIPGTPDAGYLFIDLIMYIRKSLEGALTTGGHIYRAFDLCNVDTDREYSVRAGRSHFVICRQASTFEVLMAMSDYV